MRTLTVLALLVTMTIGSTSAFAYGKKLKGRNGECMDQETRMEMMDQRREQRLERMAVLLDLTPEQQKSIKALGDKQREAQRTNSDKMRDLRDKMRDLRDAKEFNVNSYRTMAHQQADIKVDLMVQRNQHKDAILALLTPEQQEKAQKLWEMRGPKGNNDRKGGPAPRD